MTPEEQSESKQELETSTSEAVISESDTSLASDEFDIDFLTEEEKQELALHFEAPVTEREKRSLADELDIKREDTRSILAIVLISILGVTYAITIIVMLFVMFFPIEQEDERAERYTYSKDMMSLLITTQTGLVGAVLGFYFGSSRNRG